MAKFKRIELFGYPSSGKTTSMEKIVAAHPSFTPQIANVAPTIGNISKLLVFLASNPKIFRLLKWRKFAPPDYSKIYLNTIIRFMLRVMVAERDIKKNKKNLVDEGILQITWSLLLIPTLFEENFKLEVELDRIIKSWWPKSDILIYYIKIDQNEYLKRIKSRERSHFFSEEFLKDNKKVINSGEEIFDLILEKSKNIYSISLI